MGFKFLDNFVTYGGPGNPVIPGVWRGTLPTLESGGRDGTPRARWVRHSMAHGVGGALGSTIVVKMENSPVLTTAVADHRALIANTLTSKNWLIGCSWEGFAYCGVVATNDGYLHLVRGGAFEGGPNTQDVEVFASTTDSVLPFTGWAVVDFQCLPGNPGLTRVRVNGVVVLNVSAYNKNPGDYCQYVLNQPPCPALSDDLWPDVITEIVIGGPTRGTRFVGNNVGWEGYIDSVWGFDADGTYGDFVGDLKVDTLLPAGAGVLSESAITGTSPAATRWQSVDDALTPNGNIDGVLFDDTMPKTDEYTLTDLSEVDPVVYGVHALTIARRGNFGTASIRMGLHDGTNLVSGGRLKITSPAYRSQGYGFPLAPDGGDWTAADVNNLRLRLTRET